MGVEVRWHRRVWLGRLVSAWLAVSICAALYWVERAWWPVVREFQVLSMDYDAATGNLLIRGRMNKVRACRFFGLNPQVLVGGRWESVPMRFLDNPEDHRSDRPTGSQAWGLWAISMPPDQDVRYLRLTSTHRCHALWQTETELAVVPLWLAMHRGKWREAGR